MGAGHGAAHPAAVKTRIEQEPVNFLADIGCLGMLAVTKIVGRQQVVVVHNGDQMGGADFGHFVLLGIQLHDFTRMHFGHRFQAVFIRRGIGVGGDISPAGHHGFQALVGKNGPDAAAAGLLVAGAFAFGVIPGKIEAADQGVFSAGACRYHRNVSRFSLGKVLG